MRTVQISPAAAVGVAAVAVMLVVVFVLVLGDPQRQPSFSDIPEASRFYPGSVILRSGGHAATSEIRGGAIRARLGSYASVAEIPGLLRATDSPDPIWVSGGGSSGVPGTNERQVCAWHNGTVILRLGFWRLSRWQRQYPNDQIFPTVYDVRVIDRTSDFLMPTPCGIVTGD